MTVASPEKCVLCGSVRESICHQAAKGTALPVKAIRSDGQLRAFRTMADMPEPDPYAVVGARLFID